MIASDGTQHPPLQFPPGGHLVQFLSCLESSLPKDASLEPPVSSIEEAESRAQSPVATDNESETGSNSSKSRRTSVNKEESSPTQDSTEDENSFGSRARRIFPLLRRRKEVRLIFKL